MDGKVIGFIIWCVFGVMIICIGISALFMQKPMNFWANVEVFNVTDVKKYNHAVSKLFCLYGIILIVLGLPFIAGQNSAWILLSVIGVMIESIISMIVYSLVIEKKYKK